MAQVARSANARWQLRILMALVVLVPTVFWNTMDSFGVVKWTVLMVGAVVLSVLLVRRVLLDRRVEFFTTRRQLAVPGGLLLAACLATLTSPAPLTSLIGTYSYFQGLLTFVALAVVLLAVISAEKDPTLALLRALAAGAALVAAFTGLQLLGANPFGLDSRGFGDVSTTLGNPNFGSAMLGMSLPAVVHLAVASSRSVAERVALAGLAVVIVVEVALIGSAQGPITALVAGGLYAVLWGAHRFGFRRALVGTSVSAVAAVLVVVPFWGRIWNEIITSARVGRYGAWVGGWEMFLDHPVLGVGLDLYERSFPAYRPPSAALETQFSNAGQAHNVLLDLLADGGIVLGAAYVAFVVLVGYHAVIGLRRAATSEASRSFLMLGAVTGVWLGYQVQSLVSIDHTPLALVHWVTAALILRLSLQIRGREPLVVTQRHRPSQLRRAGALAAPVVALVVAWFVLVPLRADLHAGEARRLGEAGRPDLAAQELARATDLMGFRPDYWIERGLALQTAEGARAAAPFIQKGAEITEGNSRAALLMAQYYVSVDQQDRAATWFEEAVRRDPYNLEILEAAASFREDVGDQERAEELRERIEELTALQNQ